MLKQLEQTQGNRIGKGGLRPVRLAALDNVLDFELPESLEAGEPPEARGLARDKVRLMVSHYIDDRITHHDCFCEFDSYLKAGDVLILNTSGTLPAALTAEGNDGTALELHLSTRLPETVVLPEGIDPAESELWVVELRLKEDGRTSPFLTAAVGDVVGLPEGGSARLLAPYSLPTGDQNEVRLWTAELTLPDCFDSYIQQHGYPIRYNYVHQAWPLSYYQTVYANEPGSAEMPSAGRAFTSRLVTRLVARGVQIAPVLLHTGVASLEAHEPPYAEFYRVSPESAGLINAARREGRRIIAVGTTAVRVIESVTDEVGLTHAGQGWTELVITPERGIWGVDGLLTGFHEPEATHLAMLEALTGRRHLALTYREALKQKYLWHEFGDLHLILP
ncbi:MAG: S-adenosylmethionine:tRNA ribosyltransferase-isomerase [Candidatus Promineifilaceae bacterium]